MISKEHIIPLIDLTSLNTVDHSASIGKLIEKANAGYLKTYPASVCVYPKYAEQLTHKLSTSIKSCCVSTYFPSSQAPLALKLHEIAYLDGIGIDEIDIVMPIGDFLAGNYKFVEDELYAIRKKTNKTIKLIIETGLLKNIKLIEKATSLGIVTNMDFIKTSTGKTIGTDLSSVEAIAKTIRKSGQNTGLKIAGGIKTKLDVELYLKKIIPILGENYVQNGTLRIGASSLYDNLTAKTK